jgi:Ran GTPase-activating protein (RanGAP) involved in mRNA processing and transport
MKLLKYLFKITILGLGLTCSMVIMNASYAQIENKEILRALNNDPSLTSLKLISEIYSDEEFNALIQILETNTVITELILEDNDFEGDRTIRLEKALMKNKYITSINFLNRSTNIIFLLQALVRTLNLAELDLCSGHIGDTGLQVLANYLATNPTLTDLDLTGNKITDNGIKILIKALTTNNTLRNLDLRRNNLGDQGAHIIAAFLQNNNTLQRLLIGGQISIEGMRSVIKALATNKTLIGLFLDSLGDEEVELLVNMMLFNPILQELNLGGVTSQGAKLLAKLLADSNTRLTHLDLSYNKLGDEGVIAIAQTLRKNKTLTSLDLTDTNISDQAALAIIEALAHNTTLTQLYLSNDDITDKTALALAEYLRNNHSLTRLYFVCYGMTNKGVIALLEALTNNNTLKEAAINSRNIEATKELITALEKFLATNNTIANLGITIDFREKNVPIILEIRFLNALYNNHIIYDGLVVSWNTKEFRNIEKMIQERNRLRAERSELQQRPNGTMLFSQRIGEINDTLADLNQRLTEAMEEINNEPSPSTPEDPEVNDHGTVEEPEESRENSTLGIGLFSIIYDVQPAETTPPTPPSPSAYFPLFPTFPQFFPSPSPSPDFDSLF